MRTEPTARAMRVLTRPASHDRAIEILRRREPGKLLDVPCGTGALAARVRELGFEVSCCDIDPGLFGAEGLEVRKGNLNERLPYPDGSFRYVLSVAGIHRVHRLAGAAAEFARVLAPGGELILSFPNYSSLEARLRFLFRGSVSKSVNRMAFHESHTDDPDARFRHLLLYPQVHHALASVGLEMGAVLGDRSKRKPAILLFPLLALLWAVGRLAGGRKDDDSCLARANSPAVLVGGDNIIIQARKG